MYTVCIPFDSKHNICNEIILIVNKRVKSTTYLLVAQLMIIICIFPLLGAPQTVNNIYCIPNKIHSAYGLKTTVTKSLI